MSVDEIIDALGGTTEVAEAIGAKAPVVSNWRARGIPSDRWPALVDLARTKGKSITFETLAALPRPEPAAVGA